MIIFKLLKIVPLMKKLILVCVLTLSTIGISYSAGPGGCPGEIPEEYFEVRGAFGELISNGCEGGGTNCPPEIMERDCDQSE